ncbi:hypothetical protein ASPWEDRAFT_29530 [Aspergillus wentii DTO 134E9]|uniref:Fe2OG dioxygenase domain-containing protein n=1 Tax=Aspergillus wentii DTO 134E9 TaxID=1073089 RepID=A0A1L9RHH7_ASPWE|nr:uncharacterized protein ASPWEDRAFT_29530 [Aspergillus wentii DTO 134E9]KAI9925710.1 hypothetical protein MW887_005512 [Aspergillus wentii]OJJ34375.1 hypothetical protein ASPWEDRAFT_29530 [Aspergillus wentii DTO 134E9]
MSTTFESLPIVDLSVLQNSTKLRDAEFKNLSDRLYEVFSTTGFAYLVNTPLSFNHGEVFGMTREFFQLPIEAKMKMAKKTFCKENRNTYRGYFPTQPTEASDNLKEGFEIGPRNPASSVSHTSKSSKFNLSEPNVWPDDPEFSARPRLERLYEELQAFASTLLSLLAMSLGKDVHFFDNYLEDSLSTLRLLHYPAVGSSDSDASSAASSFDSLQEAKLSCTPHTDSGILTLLHQDATGGLQVRNASGKWVPAPYIPESLVVNIGDLMAKVSGGQFVATMHRVAAPKAASTDGGQGVPGCNGRLSVPFFFEPGENCIVKSVDEKDEGIVYGDHMRSKMKTWVEYQDGS